MNDALGTSEDRRTALAHFVLQMSPQDAALLQQALDLTHPQHEAPQTEDRQTGAPQPGAGD